MYFFKYLHCKSFIYNFKNASFISKVVKGLKTLENFKETLSNCIKNEKLFFFLTIKKQKVEISIEIATLFNF